MSPLLSEACAKLDIQPGAKIIGELTLKRNNSSPHVYRKVADLPNFKSGVSRLREGTEKMRVAIMCAEKDPLTCHRTVLVAHFSRDQFSDTLHILKDGSIESRAEADLRLLRESKLEKEDFFSPYKERLALAYSKRAEKIAYEEDQEQVAYG